MLWIEQDQSHNLSKKTMWNPDLGNTTIEGIWPGLLLVTVLSYVVSVLEHMQHSSSVPAETGYQLTIRNYKKKPLPPADRRWSDH